MNELLPDIQRWREDGKKVAVATVVSAYGSAPRRVGAKMAISEDGEFAGSVSGGCVENDVVEHAQPGLGRGRAAPGAVRHQRRHGVQRGPGVRRPDRGIHPAVWQGLPHREAGGVRVRDPGERPRQGVAGLGVSASTRQPGLRGRPGRAGGAGRGGRAEAGQDGPLHVTTTYRAGRWRCSSTRTRRKPTVVIFGAVHVGVSLAKFAKRRTSR